MFELIPNWHPVFVHFTVSSLSLAVIFYCIAFINKNKIMYEKLKTFADWNLWIGSGFAVVTAIAGWFAYNSVAHDTASHLAMTDHRNWALATLIIFVVLAVWAYFRKREEKTVSVYFTVLALTAMLLLSSAAWRGAEAVYRYGLGVMSLPVVSEGSDGHNHEHGDIGGHQEKNHDDMKLVPERKNTNKNGSGHDHETSHHEAKDGHENHKH